MKSTNQVASFELRVASFDSQDATLARFPFSLATRNSQLATSRRGISLLEVLIAMFVMLFGLMGVAAIFPVGNHYAGKGDQYDRGANLAGSAFAELKSRGLMRPGLWRYADGTMVIDTTPANLGNFRLPVAGAGPGHAFVIDPIGAAETPDALCNYLPYGEEPPNTNTNLWLSGTPSLSGQRWPIRRVTLPVPDPANLGSFIPMGPRVAEAIFRLRDDVTVSLPDENDRPGVLRWAADTNGTEVEYDDTRLARSYTGSYSWLATVLPVNAAALSGLQPADPRHGSFLYEVSVAVFHKREDVPSAASERAIFAELHPGGELVILAPNNDVDLVNQASQDIRPGNWIALAGVHPTTGKFLLRWYRLLSFDDETAENVDVITGTGVAARWATIEGPDWPESPGYEPNAINLRAILLPNVIGVATQTVKLETD